MVSNTAMDLLHTNLSFQPIDILDHVIHSISYKYNLYLAFYNHSGQEILSPKNKNHNSFFQKIYSDEQLKKEFEQFIALSGIIASKQHKGRIFLSQFDLPFGVCPVYFSGEYLGVIGISHFAINQADYRQLPQVVSQSNIFNDSEELKDLHSKQALTILEIEVVQSILDYIHSLLKNLEETMSKDKIKKMEKTDPEKQNQKFLKQLHNELLMPALDASLIQSLKAINNYIVLEENDHASELIVCLTSIIRVFTDNEQTLIPILQEINHIENFAFLKEKIDLQKCFYVLVKDKKILKGYIPKYSLVTTILPLVMPIDNELLISDDKVKIVDISLDLSNDKSTLITSIQISNAWMDINIYKKVQSFLNKKASELPTEYVPLPNFLKSICYLKNVFKDRLKIRIKNTYSSGILCIIECPFILEAEDFYEL